MILFSAEFIENQFPVDENGDARVCAKAYKKNKKVVDK